MTLKATSLPYASAIRKTKNSKSWDRYTLQGIASDIAGKGGLELVYECADEMPLERQEQYKESDIAFLSTLCHDHGVSLKVSDGQLILFSQAEYEAKDSVFTFRLSHPTWISYSISVGEAKTKYGSCQVTCVTGEGTSVVGKATDEDGESGQILRVTAQAGSVGEAKELAEAYLKRANLYEATASFTVPGNPAYAAGLNVTLEGFGGFDGKYVIARARHSLSSGGYTTALSLRKIGG